MNRILVTRRFFLLLIGVGFIATQGVNAQNSPHAVYGQVVTSRHAIPRAQQFYFQAFISSRPQETISKATYGCGYDEPSGTWWLNTGNFATEWQIGDTLFVHLLAFTNKSQVEHKTVAGVLTGAGSDNFGVSMLVPFKKSDLRDIPHGFLALKSQYQAGRVSLVWQTTREINNSGFIVERALASDQEFQVVGFVGGAGTAVAPMAYNFDDTPPAAESYQYRLRQINFNGAEQLSETIEISANEPEKFALRQNYPNPFVAHATDQTSIAYTLAAPGHAKIVIYDIRGREVARLLDTSMQPGTFSVHWDGRDEFGTPVASGLYFYELRFGSQQLRKAISLIR